MLKILPRMSNRVNIIITQSSLEHYSNSKIIIRELGDKIIPLSDYENAIPVFEHTLGSTKSRYIHQFFIRGRYNKLDIF